MLVEIFKREQFAPRVFYAIPDWSKLPYEKNMRMRLNSEEFSG